MRDHSGQCYHCSCVEVGGACCDCRYVPSKDDGSSAHDTTDQHMPPPATQSERDYLRSVIETAHFDLHEALSVTQPLGAKEAVDELTRTAQEDGDYDGGVRYYYTQGHDSSQDAPNAAWIDAMGAPGEDGHYSRFSPEPVEVFWAWGLDHWQCEAIAHIVRYDEKDGKLDLEKAVWWIQDLIRRKYDDGAL